MSDNFWEGASCIGHDPDMWFEPQQFRKAVAICETCPLITKCGIYALEQNEYYGVWGGLTEQDRRNLKLRIK